MDENNVNASAETEGAGESVTTESLAEQIQKMQIDLKKFDEKAGKGATEGETGGNEETIESLKALLAAERDKASKVKNAFDKAARERAAAEREAKEAKKAASAPNEELDALKKQLADLQREGNKKDLSVQLGEYGIGKDLTGKFVASIYNDDTGALVVPDLMTAIAELVDTVRETTKSSTIEEYEKEIAAGRKPKSAGKGKETDEAVSNFWKGVGVDL